MSKQHVLTIKGYLRFSILGHCIRGACVAADRETDLQQV